MQGKLLKIPDPDPVVEKLQKVSAGLESLTQSPNSERSDLRFKAQKPVFVKRDMGVDMIDLIDL
jgi:hypothetical protein